MHNRNRVWRSAQRGMSTWGWLFFAGMIAVGASAALRIGPHYIDFRIVQSVMDRLPESEVHDMSRAKIREHFSKQFRVENFYIAVRDMMKIERDRDQTVLVIDYEIREHLFYNVDFVLVFSEQRTYK
jgi:hypothetical protein